MMEVIAFILAFGYCILIALAGPVYWWVEDHAPVGKESIYYMLIILWPITILSLSPIILVLVVKYTSIGIRWAVKNLFKSLGEIANIYKAVIAR